ncbi:MAG: hypothetical protein L0I29_19740 [Hyphomicrobiales bacterium]|nr:hypothetical protein [Hyphomicrobiales bacterium]
MSTVRPLFSAFVAFSFLIVLPFAAAQAAEPADIANRLKDMLARRNVDLQWKNVGGDLSSMVLSGVTVGDASGTDKRADLGDVTLTDVTEDGDAYVIGNASVPGYSVKNAGITASITDFSISGLRLPSPDSTDPMDSVMLYDSTKVGEISVKRGGKQVFDMTGFHVNITLPKGDEPLKFDSGADSFTADIPDVGDPKTKAVIKALGYETVKGSLAMAGSWAPKTGVASLDTSRLTIEDAGSLDISLKINGCTPEFMRSLDAIRKKIAEAPEDRTQWMAQVNLMQQISLGGASIRFDDDSLTGKVMDYAAEQQGAKRGDVANQAKILLPFALMRLNNPELTAEITKAVSTFLDDPKNLTIVAALPNPMSIVEIAYGVKRAPFQLLQALGLQIIANQ